MLRLESQREGLSLFWGEELLLQHTPSSPCVRLSELPPIEWSEQGHGEGRWVRRAFHEPKRLRDYRVLENSSDRVVLNFEGLLGLEFVAEDHRVAIGFVANEEPAGLRIDLACRPGEAIFGGGADSGALVDVSHSRIEAWACEASHAGIERLFHRPIRGRDWPFMSFITASRRWYRVEGRGWMAADFRDRARLGFEFSSFPTSIVIGVGETMASALIGLGRRSGASLIPPSWSRGGPLVSTAASAEKLLGLLDRLETAGINPAGIRLLDLDVLDSSSSPDPRIAILRKRGLRALAVARPGVSIARHLDATPADEDPSETAIALDPRIDGLRIELGPFLALPGGSATELPADRVVSRRVSLLSRALRDALKSPDGRAGDRLTEGSFLLSSDRGWGMEASMHCCSLPAILDDVAGIPRRSSALLAHGLSGGGWAWLDASSLWSPGQARRRSSALAGIARRRAIELAAFGPVLEFEAPIDGGPGEDDELRFLARMSLIFSMLLPYHEAVATEYRDSPLPPIRHTFAHYEDGASARRLASQYFYGRDLLIAVSGSQGEFVSVDLPADEWVHLWSSRRFRGGPVSIEAPPGQPAVFCRASSAFSPLFDSIRRATRRK